MKKTINVQLITYNDCYGNGNTSIEGIILDGTFDKWLEEHNAMRDAEPEGPEEFDLDDYTVEL